MCILKGSKNFAFTTCVAPCHRDGTCVVGDFGSRLDAFFFRTGDEYVKKITHGDPTLTNLMELSTVQLMKAMNDSEVRVPSSANKTRIATTIIEDRGNICAHRQSKFEEFCQVSALTGKGGPRW